MEPVKPLLKSDKAIQTPAQEAQLKEIIAHAGDAWKINRIEEFSSNVSFTPTQSWIKEFENLGLYFYQDLAVPYAQFRIEHKSRPKLGEDPVPPKPEPAWVPQNGELIEAFWGGWYRAIYIGRDEDMDCYVVRSEKEGKYCHPKEIRKCQKTQVPLAELLSVYASVKGLTQDGVELKPEN